MKMKWNTSFGILVCMCVGAWVASAGIPVARSVLLPHREAAINAAHARHASEQIACDTCHPTVTTSRRADDRNLPSMDLCRPCHDDKIGPAPTWSKSCAYCHESHNGSLVARGVESKSRLKFSHRAHRKHNCTSCHSAGGEDLLSNISMKQCFNCHDKSDRASTSCRTCHKVAPDGVMKTRFDNQKLLPPEWLAGNTHGVNWAGGHAKAAGRDSAFCANCHRETECQSCHTGRIRQKNIHPSDWLNTHGTHSTMDNPRCLSCHRAQSFCISCHRRSGVAPDAPTNKRSQRPADFHRGASPAQICRRARTNIAACASCHSENSCTTCHANINPHPVGFSRRCKPLAKQNKRACAKCHQQNAEQLCR